MTTLYINPNEPIDDILSDLTTIAKQRVDVRDDPATTIAYETAGEAMDHLNAISTRLELLPALWAAGALCGDEFLDYLDQARLSNPSKDRGGHILHALCQRSLEEYLNEEIAS